MNSETNSAAAEKISEQLYDFLAAQNISYTRHDHPAVYTVEQAKEFVPELPGAATKNLFLRDRKGKRHFLLVVAEDVQVDIVGLGETLGTSRLSFGSAERLMRHLGIESGSVSLLALFNDKEHGVELLIDSALWEADAFLCHPLINTATLVIRKIDLQRFLAATGHEAHLLAVPNKALE